MYLSDTQNKQNVPSILIRDIEHNSFQFSTIALYTDQIKKHSYHKTDQAFFLSKTFTYLRTWNFRFVESSRKVKVFSMVA